MSARIRTAFLDFDRTLGEMVDGHYAIYVQACEEQGVAASIEALSALALDDAWARFATSEGPAHPDVSSSHETFLALRAAIAIERLRAAGVEADERTFGAIGARIADLEEQPEQYRLYDDTLPGIERLGRYGIAAIVVSNHVWTLPEIVRALDGHARFEGVVTSARAGYRKPHPGIFEAALRLGTGSPAETLMVGDNPHADIEGGRRLGLRPVLIDRSAEPATRVDGGMVVTTLLDLPVEWPS